MRAAAGQSHRGTSKVHGDKSHGSVQTLTRPACNRAAGFPDGLPAVLGIAPALVVAATGAALLFAGAVITRLRRGEKATIVVGGEGLEE